MTAVLMMLGCGGEPPDCTALVRDAEQRAVSIEDGPWQVDSVNADGTPRDTDIARVTAVKHDLGAERFQRKANFSFLKADTGWSVQVDPGKTAIECTTANKCLKATASYDGSDPDSEQDEPCVAEDPLNCESISTAGYHQDGIYKVEVYFGSGPNAGADGFYQVTSVDGAWREALFSKPRAKLPWPNDDKQDDTPGERVRWKILPTNLSSIPSGYPRQIEYIVKG